MLGRSKKQESTFSDEEKEKAIKELFYDSEGKIPGGIIDHAWYGVRKLKDLNEGQQQAIQDQTGVSFGDFRLDDSIYGKVIKVKDATEVPASLNLGDGTDLESRTAPLLLAYSIKGPLEGTRVNFVEKKYTTDNRNAYLDSIKLTYVPKEETTGI